jgi:hypothetical protein
VKGKWLIAAVISAMLGVLHALLLGGAWNHLVLINPVPHWLITHGVTGKVLRWLLFTQDAIINALLCLPLVFALRLLRPFHPWAYLVVAMLAEEAWAVRYMFANPLPRGLGYGSFLSGLLALLVAFAMAGVVLEGMSRMRRSPA